ncbi:hypothetical protein ACF1AU_06645 [Streptomyces rubrogriseus]|uniref:hypothetical protein n=1 Tax=Streptomyces rubrogriseus TaxID=194673 RepID=UPI0037000672
MEETSGEDVRSMFDVRVAGVWNLLRAPRSRSQGGELHRTCLCGRPPSPPVGDGTTTST